MIDSTSPLGNTASSVTDDEVVTVYTKPRIEHLPWQHAIRISIGLQELKRAADHLWCCATVAAVMMVGPSNDGTIHAIRKRLGSMQRMQSQVGKSAHFLVGEYKRSLFSIIEIHKNPSKALVPKFVGLEPKSTTVSNCLPFSN